MTDHLQNRYWMWRGIGIDADKVRRNMLKNLEDQKDPEMRDHILRQWLDEVVTDGEKYGRMEAHDRVIARMTEFIRGTIYEGRDDDD